jgi:hypothetical protein
MDQHSPEFYCDASVEDSMQGAAEVVQYIKVRFLQHRT